jgi:hypothetical protein
MRRLSIGILILSLCSLNAQAQLLHGFGCRIGVAFANQDFDYTIAGFELDTKTRVGFDIALYAEWLNTPFFHIVTEIHDIQKG